VFDGGASVPGGATWDLPFLAATGSSAFRADLELSAAAQDCDVPLVDLELEWPRSPGTACGDRASWSLADVATPPVDCTTSGPSDLLREAGLLDLDLPLFPPLSSLLDASGRWDTCRGGTTRLGTDAAHVFDTDVATRLASGILIPDDALPVSRGGPAAVVFYEVSNSCASIRTCRVDADGESGNGRESVLVKTGACPP
jgi:hypothetical protein